MIELDSEAGLESADLVFDLNQTYNGQAVAFRPNLSLLPMLREFLHPLNQVTSKCSMVSWESLR